MTAPHSLKPYRSGLCFSMSNAVTWVITLGSPMVLLLQALGATTFQVGLTYSFVFLLLPIQVVATALLPILGYRRQLMLAWGTRTVFLAIPITLAILAPDNPPRWMPGLVVFSMFAFSFFRAIGSSVYSPWLYSLLPDRIRGRYFATDSLLTGLSGMLTLVFCAWLNANLPDYTAFSYQFSLAALGAILAVYAISRIPQVANPRMISLKTIARQTPQLLFTKGPFRHYLILSTLVSVASTPFVPFSVYYLKVEQSFPDSSILIYAALQYAGAIVGSSITRSWVDRLGVRPFFAISLSINVLVYLFWIGLLADTPGLSSVVAMTFFAVGIAQANWFAAHMKFLPQLSSDDDRPVSVAVLSSTVGFLAGLAPMAWGLLLRGNSEHPAMNETWFFLYFISAILLLLVLLPFFIRLAEDRPEAEPVRVPLWAVRPFRYVTSMVNLLDSRQNNKRPPSQKL